MPYQMLLIYQEIHFSPEIPLAIEVGLVNYASANENSDTTPLNDFLKAALSLLW